MISISIPSAMMTSLVVTALFVMLGISCGDTANLSPNYVAEVYFVVEPQVIRNYIKLGYTRADAISTLRGDIEYYIYQVNELFKSTSKFGLNMEIRQKHLTIMDGGEEMFVESQLIRKNLLHSGFGLAIFEEWLRKTDAYDKIGYDIPLLWTGYDVFASLGKMVSGHGILEAACTKNAKALVEFDGTMAGVITTAQTIAFNLGSLIDNTDDCPSSEGYIMAKVTRAINQHRWEFSHCSVSSIVKYIDSLTKSDTNCLAKTTTPNFHFHFPAQSNRDILNVEKTCERVRVDPNSYFCKYNNIYNGSDIKGDPVCKAIYCAEIGNASCVMAKPPEGMVCDVNKRCEKGKCVAAAFPTQHGIDSECIFGDIRSDLISQERLTCVQAVIKYGEGSCYKINKICCKTCGELKTNLNGCEYGDRSKMCQNYTANQICDVAKNREICCYRCRNYVGKRSALNETQVELTDDLMLPIVNPVLVEYPIPAKVSVSMD